MEKRPAKPPKKCTKEPCLATKGTPITRVTLNKEKKTYTKGEKNRKKSLLPKEKN